MIVYVGVSPTIICSVVSWEIWLIKTVASICPLQKAKIVYCDVKCTSRAKLKASSPKERIQKFNEHFKNLPGNYPKSLINQSKMINNQLYIKLRQFTKEDLDVVLKEKLKADGIGRNYKVSDFIDLPCEGADCYQQVIDTFGRLAYLIKKYNKISFIQWLDPYNCMEAPHEH